MIQYRIAFYLRISMEDADSRTGVIKESQSITNQRDLLYQFVASQPHLDDNIITEFCDDGYSGTNLERPEMKKLLQLASAHQIDCVIVKDFSRFARNYLEVSDYVDSIFPVLGIRVISVNDNYDSAHMSGNTSRIDLKLRFIFDAYYPWDISQRTRSGKRTKALTGAYVNPYAPIGYKKDPKDKNKLVIDEASADIVRRIFHLSGLGMSTKEIAYMFNAEKVPTPSQIKKQQGFNNKWWVKNNLSGEFWACTMINIILRDERYLGKLIYYKRHRSQIGSYKLVKSDKSEIITVENTHEPLITNEEFKRVQNNLREFKERGKYQAKENLFSGKIICAHCGYALGCDKKRYFCVTKRTKTDYLGCMKGSISESSISAIILAAVQTHVKVFLENQRMLIKDNSNATTATLRKQSDAYKQSIANTNERKAELYDEFVDKKINREQFVVKRDKIMVEQKEMESRIEKLEQKINDMEQALNEFKDDGKKYENYLLCDSLTKLMVEEFVEKIVVYSENFIQIKWNFCEGLEDQKLVK